MIRASALLALLAAIGAAACAPRASTKSCPSGQERCDGICVDPAAYANDPRNCGGCAVFCAAGASCAAGTCACPAGQVVCNRVCVDLATNGANCGGCGIGCGVGTCAAGACDCGAFLMCPDRTPRCVDGLHDPDHCGTTAAACTSACPLAGEACDLGVCACPAGTTQCPEVAPTVCVNLQNDESNCGRCGNPCPLGATCTNGSCLCPPGESVCNGACVDTSTDESNCGTCGWTCPSGATCATRSCACPSGQPRICGPGASGGGTCCAGDGCCTANGVATCETDHDNGLGQHFYDCVPLETYDLAQAEKAAAAWHTSSSPPESGENFACPGCIGWHATIDGISYCGTWCYSGGLAGHASVQQSLVCGCPYAASPTWN